MVDPESGLAYANVIGEDGQPQVDPESGEPVLVPIDPATGQPVEGGGAAADPLAWAWIRATPRRWRPH